MMNQKPYSSYRGRKSLGRRILTAIAIVLAIALALAVVALFVLPNHMVYNGDKIQFDWPVLGGGKSEPTAPADDGEEEPTFIIEEPDDVTPSSAPAAEGGDAADIDLSFYTRREVPRGLVSTAGAGPAAGQGAIFDMTGEMLSGNGDLNPDREAARALNASLPYAAAWLAPDWSAALADPQFAENLTQRCLLLADSGYDELLFSEAVPADDGSALAKLYRDVKAALDGAGWQGRLGLVLDQSLAGSGYAEDLLPAIAQSFDRLYFRSALRDGVRAALVSNGFSSSYADIVTLYAAPTNVSWAWAVLPQ